MTHDIHIASFIVQTHPASYGAVLAQLEQYSDLEVPLADSRQSKVIAIMESRELADLKERVNWLEQLRGVLSVTLVYHQVEPEQEMQKEWI